MKKFFKKTVKFLFEIVLMSIMLLSAQHVMNLPLGWACFGYIVIFCAALEVWTNTHHKYDQYYKYYKEGIITGQEIQRIRDVMFIYADDGEDEFKITAPNEVIFSPRIQLLAQNIIESPDNHYRYKVASMINHGTETEVTFTKIN